MNQQSKVAVIGAGVMGEALISALISYGVKPEFITISEKRDERAAELIAKYSIKVAPLGANVSSADALLLVVKPQDMGAVLEEIKGSINPAAVVVTFAAGKTISFISNGLGTGNPVVRVMPNTPTLVGAGMAAASMGAGVTDAQKGFVLGFLAATGKVIEVGEELQDAVTATSGSGPAYFFAFVEAMVAGAKELGLSDADATTLTVQTIVGAAKLLDESGKSATTLRENVTSPNGTTAAALASFVSSDLNSMVAKAMKAARDRSQELA
jgi:pyrroline-5-carboxylate reductase